MGTTWGSASTTKDFSLYMEGDDPIDAPHLLENHGMSDLSPDNIDRVLHRVTRRVKGKSVTLSKVLRPTERTGLTFTMLFNGFLHSPALQLARRGTSCPKTLYLVRNCPPNDREKHARVLTDVILDRPTFVNAVIEVDENANIATEQSEGYASEEFILWNLGGFLVRTLAEPVYAIAPRDKDCLDCDTSPFQEFAAVASNGSGNFKTYLTEDRFATTTSPTAIGAAAPSASIPTSVYYKDDVILVGFRNGSSTSGGTVFSSDNGATATVDAGISEAIRAVGFFDGQYIAVGGNAGGQAVVYLSDNGINWTSVTSPALPNNKAILGMAIDHELGNVYFVGETGLALKAYRSGANSLIITAMTMPGSPGNLNTVAVLGNDHVAVGGASGYYAETFDGGTNWEQPQVTATGTIRSITGNKYRTVYAAGSVSSVRDILNNIQYKNVKYEQTISGNVVTCAYDGDPNYFVLGSDAGEVIVLRPFHPDA